MKTQTVDHNVPARTTSVLTHAACHVAKGPTARFRTMWPSADVPGALQEILSGTAGGSQGMRFVLPVEPTLTVRLAKMTVPSVVANLPISEILCKDVAMNVILMESVASHRLVIVRITDVNLLVAMECVGKMQTAKQSTTGPSAHVLLTSLVTHSPAATQSAPDTMIVHLTKPVSS